MFFFLNIKHQIWVALLCGKLRSLANLFFVLPQLALRKRSTFTMVLSVLSLWNLPWCLTLFYANSDWWLLFYYIIFKYSDCRYKECFNKLRNLKTEIEHLQHLLEKSKVKMMKDFEMWWAKQSAKMQVRIMGSINTVTGWENPIQICLQLENVWSHHRKTWDLSLK